jgi:hypothetical protein
MIVCVSFSTRIAKAGPCPEARLTSESGMGKNCERCMSDAPRRGAAKDTPKINKHRNAQISAPGRNREVKVAEMPMSKETTPLFK